MQSSFHNSAYFRFFSPIIFGIIVYVLILLIFNDINQLSEDFFSIQVILPIIIAFFVSELNRIIVNTIEKHIPSNFKLSRHIVIQIVLTSVFTIILTSLFVGTYMHYLVGFKNFKTELIVFNSIFFMLSLCYSLMYFNILYAKKMNEIHLVQAEQAKKESEIELEAYKSRMNPELLSKSLETLICYAVKDPVIADDYILKISDFYRSILNNKRSELIDLEKELKTAENFIYLQNSWHNNNIIFTSDVDIASNMLKIVPGTLYVFLEHVISNSIISPILPLDIICKVEEKQLIIECLKRDKIHKSSILGFEIERLQKAYEFYSDLTPTIDDKGGSMIIKIPLFELIKK